MPQKPLAAVIVFPGTNCELETATALSRNGFESKVLLWNEVRSLAKFDSVILAGGFSYEDRGRAGLIASHDRAVKAVAKVAASGKPILGICNGAQILVETGLVPMGRLGASSLTLTRNRRVNDQGQILGTGFYNAWIHVKSGTTRETNAFNNFPEGTVLRIPAAHAEGRFVTPDAELLAKLVENGQNAFIYCDESGELDPNFPTNPNGSVLNLAGVTNPAGNILALMPHPERAITGDPIFRSMRKHLGARSKACLPARQEQGARKVLLPRWKGLEEGEIKPLPKPKFDAEIFVSLKITDNEALSVESAVQEFGAETRLSKFRWFGIDLRSQASSLRLLEKIIRSGDLLNIEKEEVIVKFRMKFYHFDKGRGLIPMKFRLPSSKTLATERETSLNLSRQENINHLLGKPAVTCLKSGILWVAKTGKGQNFEKAVRANFFHHPAAMDLVKI